VKVIHVVPELDPCRGGPSVSIIGLALGLESVGCAVTILAGRLRRDGSPIELNGRCTQFIQCGRAPIGFIRMWAEIRSIRFSCTGAVIVVIHSVWNLWSTIAAAACRLYSLPYIIVPHGMLTDDALKRRAIKKRIYHYLVDRSTVGSAWFVRFLTAVEKEKSSKGWVPVGRSVILPNGVDVDEVSQRSVSPDDALESSEPYFMFLGRVHEIKNIELQVRALAIVRLLHPSVKLLIVGPDAGQLSRIKALACKMGVADMLVIVGAVNDARRFTILSKAVALLQTSFHEAHSMSVNEALACGVPVIITQGVHYEDVRRFNAGIIIEGSQESLADAMVRLLTEPCLARRMGENGRSYAAKNLDWRQIAAGFLACCNRQGLNGDL
jgi:glycosyltransferase involved in cell wall biosynthesis